MKKDQLDDVLRNTPRMRPVFQVKSLPLWIRSLGNIRIGDEIAYHEKGEYGVLEDGRVVSRGYPAAHTLAQGIQGIDAWNLEFIEYRDVRFPWEHQR